MTTTTETKTTTNSDGSKTTETKETATDKTTGAKTETTKTETVDKTTGVTATTEIVKQDGRTTATAEIAVPAASRTQDGKTTATLTDQAAGKLASQAQAAVDAAKKAGAGDADVTVTIQVDAKADAQTVEVGIPAQALADVAKTGADVTISSNAAEITLDAAAVQSLAGGTGETATLSVSTVDAATLPQAVRDALPSENALVLDLSAAVGGKAVTDFAGGWATVSVPYTPTDAAKAVAVYYVADDGTLTKLDASYDAKTGKVSFTTPHFSYYTVAEETPAAPFTDVAPDAWYAQAVERVAARGLFAGTGDGAFSPDAAMTRGMVVTVLYRLAGQPAADAAGAYPDVPPDAYCAAAVAWAGDKGVVSGYSGGRFAPDDAITREQLAALLYRYAQQAGGDVSADADMSAYPDGAEASGYAVPALRWACGAGILQGGSGGLMPQAAATRAQVAVMLTRYLDGAE